MVKVILIFAIILTFWKSSYGAEIQKIAPTLEGETLHLYCDEDHPLDNLNNCEAFQETTHIKTLIIDSCPPPSNNRSYAVVLKELNVSVDGIKVLHLVKPSRSEAYSNHDGPDPRRPQSHHFSGLYIEELQILNQNALAALAIDLNFLQNLTDLTKVVIVNCDIWGAFPNTTKLERVELSGGVLYGDIGACQKFKVLHLTELNIFGGKDEYRYKRLKDCKELVELKLERMDSGECEQNLLQSLSRTVSNITVRYSRLREFPYSYTLYTEPYADQEYDENIHDYLLKHLDVSHNHLQTASFVNSHKALETLDLSHNYIQFGMYYLRNVTDLKQDHIDLEKYCDPALYRKNEPSDEYMKKVPLKRLSATYTGMRALCFGGMNLTQLELLNLTHNNIAVLDYRELYNVSGDNYEVDLRYNPLEKVEISQDDYEALKRNDSSVAAWRKIKIRTTARFPCNCSNAWFTRAMRDGLLTVEGATCDDGAPIDQPRISYALQGCPAACEGTPGCSDATLLRKIMNVKDKIITLFTEQNSLWWIVSRCYDRFVNIT